MDEKVLKISGRLVERENGQVICSKLSGSLVYQLSEVEAPHKEPELYAELCPEDGDYCLILRPEGQSNSLDITLLPDGGLKVQVLPKRDAP